MLESKSAQATLRVWRGDAKGGEFVEYKVPREPGMVVLDALHYIQAHYTPDLAVRWNCKAAKCGSCSAEVNGKPRLMCKTRLAEFAEESIITVAPMKTFPLIKDLVTDVSWNYNVAKQIPPFQPEEDGDSQEPWTIYQRDIDRVQEFHKCIECFLCQNVCHVLRSHQKLLEFAGPRFLIKLAALEMHPMDRGRRLEHIKEAAGIGFCNITKCCTEVCPEEIAITDNAIIPLKERLADEYYDPLRWLLRRIFAGGTVDTSERVR